MLEKKFNNYSYYIGRIELFNKNKKEAKKHFGLLSKTVASEPEVQA